METKSGVGIQDHWMKGMMEPAAVENDARSVKREKMAETYNGNENYDKQQADMRFRCDDCNLTFEGMEYLLLHKKFHGNVNEKDAPMLEAETSERPAKEGPKKRRKFKCDQCDVKVNSQYHLDIHRSKHEGAASKKFICEVCDRSFVAAQFLKSHMQTHSSVSTINCEICNKSFTGQAYLKLHMQLHNDIKKFKCGKCEEMFPTKNCLKLHMKKHTKVKNFKCDYCNKLFVSKITMEKHRQTHEGQPADCLLKCTQCDRTMHSSLLRTHMTRAHPPNVDDDVKRPFKCSTCGKSFIMKINLNLHIRVCHPDLAEPEDEEEEVMTDNS
ncbi:zinc finger protein draculin-like [Pectinophora gossypiella]|uniref:C2H2-type domain-containing protein n=1 Tax=Pectinophora gossypiella TaxID=13191 RepID=A0A1E1W2K6_PECGO|nr:zinc finger protein draculin-like [Pectinophora gossypiella]